MVSKVEDSVVNYYLRSPDFNGINLLQLESEFGVDVEKITQIVIDLVRRGRISVVSPRQSNPFIKMIDVPVEEQLDGLGKRKPQFVCLYPTRIAVEGKVNPADWDDRPFTKLLVLAAPQLSPSKYLTPTKKTPGIALTSTILGGQFTRRTSIMTTWMNPTR